MKKLDVVAQEITGLENILHTALESDVKFVIININQQGQIKDQSQNQQVGCNNQININQSDLGKLAFELLSKFPQPQLTSLRDAAIAYALSLDVKTTQLADKWGIHHTFIQRVKNSL